MWQTYQKHQQISLSYSSFRDRFSPQLLHLLGLIKAYLLTQLPKTPQHKAFGELLVIDSTIFSLFQSLKSRYSSTSKRLASAKMHLVYSVSQCTAKQVKISGARCADNKAFKKIGNWVDGRLLLMDKGYQEYGLWRRIDEKQGFFFAALRVNGNPLIILEDGKVSLKEYLKTANEKVFDFEAELNHRKRAYRGKRSKAILKCRMIGIRRDDGSYWVYVTNLSHEQLKAADARQLYRLRWQVELFFKALKQYAGLSSIKSGNETIVKILIELTMIAALLAASLKLALEARITWFSSTPLKFFAALSSLATQILSLLSPYHITWSSIQCSLLRHAQSRDILHPINTDFLIATS